MTFSIVAYDPVEQAWGIAVASKFLAAGAVVSWARAEVGAVATQSYAKVSFGADGLALMHTGKTAAVTLAELLAHDPQREKRQVGIVDAYGNAAAHTGADCHGWAGHHIGEGFTCQGNILVGANVIAAMAAAYRTAQGELADRLITAIAAGDRVGGDKRGKQSAAVLVVKHNGGYGGDNDRYLDLRVDDDPQPIPKLQAMAVAHHLFFGTAKPEDQLPITPAIARELQRILIEQGYLSGEVTDEWTQPIQQAFWTLVGNENLEERWTPDQNPEKIDRVALDYLRQRFG